VGFVLGTPAQVGEAATAATTVTDFLTANTMGFATITDVTTAATTVTDYLDAMGLAVPGDQMDLVDAPNNTALVAVAKAFYDYLMDAATTVGSFGKMWHDYFD
jgi:hypothetical protein